MNPRRDPKLPADRVDDTLIVDSYHEFAYPREVMEAGETARTLSEQVHPYTRQLLEASPGLQLSLARSRAAHLAGSQ